MKIVCLLLVAVSLSCVLAKPDDVTASSGGPEIPSPPAPDKPDPPDRPDHPDRPEPPIPTKPEPPIQAKPEPSARPIPEKPSPPVRPSPPEKPIPPARPEPPARPIPEKPSPPVRPIPPIPARPSPPERPIPPARPEPPARPIFHARPMPPARPSPPIPPRPEPLARPIFHARPMPPARPSPPIPPRPEPLVRPIFHARPMPPARPSPPIPPRPGPLARPIIPIPLKPAGPSRPVYTKEAKITYVENVAGETVLHFDDFFSDLDKLETSTTADSATTTTESASQDVTTAVPEVSTAVALTNDGRVLANYTPEIGYKMADTLSDQIRLFLKHFQQKDPIGIPGAVLPDPMPLPDLTKSLGILGSVTFKNIQLFELSQFRLSHINTDLERMQIYVEIEMKRLVSLGNYSMRTMMKSAKGPFNITMTNVVAEGAVALERDDKGQLQATDSQMDMTCSNIIIDLKDSGMTTFVDGLGPFMFQSIKPVLLRKLNTDIRADINKQIKKFTAKIPKNVSPLDLGIYEARRYVRNNHYDPYQLKNYSYKINLIRVNISDLWLEGLSNFNRVGDLSLSMDHGVIQFGIHVITSKLHGYLKWSANFANKRSVTEGGTLKYSVDYLQVRISVNQSVNINNKPILDDIDLRVGKIHINHTGLKSFDIIINSIVNNYIPDILKFLIIDSIEGPLKVKIQEVLPKLDEFVSTFNENRTYPNVTYDTTPVALKLTTTAVPETTTLVATSAAASAADVKTSEVPAKSTEAPSVGSGDVTTQSDVTTKGDVKIQGEALAKTTERTEVEGVSEAKKDAGLTELEGHDRVKRGLGLEEGHDRVKRGLGKRLKKMWRKVRKHLPPVGVTYTRKF
ncbi:hypothetical protein M8J76_000526 [Diaphorina citri]|nr:hypothetical protein M8J76_000526 [Diaphorina citri]